MPPSPTHQLVDHLFRHETGRLVSVLTRIFGIDRMELAEDVVQEALLKALQVWPYRGIPENPSAWIMTAARNKAFDVIRRERNILLKQEDIIAESSPGFAEPGKVFTETEIRDDQLRMMFACCHPSLPPESQIAMILRTLCGFGVEEIARAFLSNRETIHKRLVRARQKLRKVSPPFEIPNSGHDAAQLDAVLRAMYLLFNEGYNASSGETLIRNELCEEAIRLAHILAYHPSGNRPETHGLLSLMLFHGARLKSRTDDLGNLLLLQDQDRNLWDREMIAAGFRELEESAEGEEISQYQLEAGIASCHCIAADYRGTDWKRILMLYDLLIQVNDSPVVFLNRAVAVSKVDGPEAGIRAVEGIRNSEILSGYYLLHAVLGEFHSELGNHKEAVRSYRRALALTQVRSERVFLSERLQSLN